MGTEPENETKPELSIVIPTYNERENIPILLEGIFGILRNQKINGEIIVVDDNSPDGTGAILDQLKTIYRGLIILHRSSKNGLSSAVMAGFERAHGEILGVMDADLSHPLEKIPEMFRLIKEDIADLVIGSRYMKGGGIEGWGPYRKILSWGAITLSRIFTPVEDTMSGFFMIRRACFDGIDVNPQGFKILLEILVKTNCKRVIEIPIVFTNRTRGESKAGVGEIIAYLGNLLRYLPHRLDVIGKFLKFGLVGTLGLLVNLAVLYALKEYAGLHYLTSATLAFFIAVTSNFFLNKIWTFREKIANNFGRKYIRFFAVSIGGLAINLTLLYILVEFAELWYIVAQIIAVGIAFVFNFVGNTAWTFRDRKY